MLRTQRLGVVLVLNLALVAALVTVGVTAHSLALLAEGSDYLLDAAGVGVTLLAIWLSARPASRARPGGSPNATSVAAVVSGVAAAVMTPGALVLHGDADDDGTQERDLSVAAVLLDTVADAAAAAGVAAAGAIILATGGWYWLDPAAAAAIAVVVAYHALALIRKVLTRLRPAAG